MSKTYEAGMQDGIRLWGKVCGSMPNCDVCPIKRIRGASTTCQEFAKQFPSKFLSSIKNVDNEGYSYADEMVTRFPNMGFDANKLTEQGICRKMIFEGVVECESFDCLSCWNTPYTGDVTEGIESEVEEDEGVSTSGTKGDALDDFE